jgi:hypothetical protein
MRKIVPLFALLAGALTGFCQGYVTFLNDVAFQTTDSTGGNRLVWLDVIGGTKLTGTQYTAELYAGPDANGLIPIAASLARFRPSTTLQPGTWNFPAGLVTLPGFDVGASIVLQVRVWENASGGASYDQAMVKNASNTFNYTVPPDRPGTFLDSYMEGFQAFALVPEPSAGALGGIGLGCLLVLCRRKR